MLLKKFNCDVSNCFGFSNLISPLKPINLYIGSFKKGSSLSKAPLSPFNKAFNKVPYTFAPLVNSSFHYKRLLSSLSSLYLARTSPAALFLNKPLTPFFFKGRKGFKKVYAAFSKPLLNLSPLFPLAEGEQRQRGTKSKKGLYNNSIAASVPVGYKLFRGLQKAGSPSFWSSSGTGKEELRYKHGLFKKKKKCSAVFKFYPYAKKKQNKKLQINKIAINLQAFLKQLSVYSGTSVETKNLLENTLNNNTSLLKNNLKLQSSIPAKLEDMPYSSFAGNTYSAYPAKLEDQRPYMQQSWKKLGISPKHLDRGLILEGDQQEGHSSLLRSEIKAKGLEHSSIKSLAVLNNLLFLPFRSVNKKSFSPTLSQTFLPKVEKFISAAFSAIPEGDQTEDTKKSIKEKKDFSFNPPKAFDLTNLVSSRNSTVVTKFVPSFSKIKKAQKKKTVKRGMKSELPLKNGINQKNNKLNLNKHDLKKKKNSSKNVNTLLINKIWGNPKNFYTSYTKLEEVKLVTIALASAEKIRQWAERTLPNGKIVGQVTNANTLHHKTFKPQKGGLFCERIFGPLKDYECACGKKQLPVTSFGDSVFTKKGPLLLSPSGTGIVNEKGSTTVHESHNKHQIMNFCAQCDVQYTRSVIRRYQLGYIDLVSPVTHVWYLKGNPSYISILLDIKKKQLEHVTYCVETLTLEHSLNSTETRSNTPSNIFASWQKLMNSEFVKKENKTSNAAKTFIEPRTKSVSSLSISAEGRNDHKSIINKKEYSLSSYAGSPLKKKGVYVNPATASLEKAGNTKRNFNNKQLFSKKEKRKKSLISSFVFSYSAKNKIFDPFGDQKEKRFNTFKKINGINQAFYKKKVPLPLYILNKSISFLPLYNIFVLLLKNKVKLSFFQSLKIATTVLLKPCLKRFSTLDLFKSAILEHPFYKIQNNHKFFLNSGAFQLVPFLLVSFGDEHISSLSSFAFLLNKPRRGLKSPSFWSPSETGTYVNPATALLEKAGKSWMSYGPKAAFHKRLITCLIPFLLSFRYIKGKFYQRFAFIKQNALKEHEPLCSFAVLNKKDKSTILLKSKNFHKNTYVEFRSQIKTIYNDLKAYALRVSSLSYAPKVYAQKGLKNKREVKNAATLAVSLLLEKIKTKILLSFKQACALIYKKAYKVAYVRTTQIFTILMNLKFNSFVICPEGINKSWGLKKNMLKTNYSNSMLLRRYATAEQSKNNVFLKLYALHFKNIFKLIKKYLKLHAIKKTEFALLTVFLTKQKCSLVLPKGRFSLIKQALYNETFIALKTFCVSYGERLSHAQKGIKNKKVKNMAQFSIMTVEKRLKQPFDKNISLVTLLKREIIEDSTLLVESFAESLFPMLIIARLMRLKIFKNKDFKSSSLFYYYVWPEKGIVPSFWSPSGTAQKKKRFNNNISSIKKQKHVLFGQKPYVKNDFLQDVIKTFTPSIECFFPDLRSKKRAPKNNVDKKEINRPFKVYRKTGDFKQQKKNVYLAKGFLNFEDFGEIAMHKNKTKLEPDILATFSVDFLEPVPSSNNSMPRSLLREPKVKGIYSNFSTKYVNLKGDLEKNRQNLLCSKSILRPRPHFYCDISPQKAGDAFKPLIKPLLNPYKGLYNNKGLESKLNKRNAFMPLGHTALLEPSKQLKKKISNTRWIRKTANIDFSNNFIAPALFRSEPKVKGIVASNLFLEEKKRKLNVSDSLIPKVSNKIVNNIYVLSHRHSWNDTKQWHLIQNYMGVGLNPILSDFSFPKLININNVKNIIASALDTEKNKKLLKKVVLKHDWVKKKQFLRFFKPLTPVGRKGFKKDPAISSLSSFAGSPCPSFWSPSGTGKGVYVNPATAKLFRGLQKAGSTPYYNINPYPAYPAKLEDRRQKKLFYINSKKYNTKRDLICKNVCFADVFYNNATDSPIAAYGFRLPNFAISSSFDFSIKKRSANTEEKRSFCLVSSFFKPLRGLFNKKQAFIKQTPEGFKKYPAKLEKAGYVPVPKGNQKEEFPAFSSAAGDVPAGYKLEKLEKAGKKITKSGPINVSGASLVKKLLLEFDTYELKKLDKQNRILLYELNTYIDKLKKKIFTKTIKKQLTQWCYRRDALMRRTKLVRKIFRKQCEPHIMVLSLLPVLPPDLRPIVKIGGQIAASDLNRLYQRVIYRNDRLKKFLKDKATGQSYEMKYAQRLLQEAVDNLIQNGKTGVQAEVDSRGRLLKSLSDILKGKQGRFRQYLLGKRVDYSGRSVIVVAPKLKLHQCGLPKEMAIELYLPFLLKRILNENLAKTVVGAKLLIKTNKTLTWQLLREIMQICPVLLNRAPTLHRLGFQAFQPKLIEGRAILLHPLVCSAFNADFDGDQMAVHVPITAEARAEAWKLMLSRNNLLSAATGEPIAIPSQDMVLGCYYLTTNCNTRSISYQTGSSCYFSNFNDVLKAYNQQRIDVHAMIWVKWEGSVENSTVEALMKKQIPSSIANSKHTFKNSSSSLYPDSPSPATLFLNKPRRDLKKAVAGFTYTPYYNKNPDRGLIPEEDQKKERITLLRSSAQKDIKKKKHRQQQALEIRVSQNGQWQEIHPIFFKTFSVAGSCISQYVRTTAGRILFNTILTKQVNSDLPLSSLYAKGFRIDNLENNKSAWSLPSHSLTTGRTLFQNTDFAGSHFTKKANHKTNLAGLWKGRQRSFSFSSFFKPQRGLFNKKQAFIKKTPEGFKKSAATLEKASSFSFWSRSGTGVDPASLKKAESMPYGHKTEKKTEAKGLHFNTKKLEAQTRLLQTFENQLKRLMP